LIRQQFKFTDAVTYGQGFFWFNSGLRRTSVPSKRPLAAS
jgi:hypothetical protein